LDVEADDPVRVQGQVGDNEADGRKQLAGMPFDLGDDAATLVSRCRLILEVAIVALDPLEWSANGTLHQMGDAALQHRGGAQQVRI